MFIWQPEKAMGLLNYTEKNMFGSKSPEKEKEKEKEDPGGENSWDIWRPILSVVCLHLAVWVKISAEVKYFSYFFPENRLWHFMQIVSIGDNLHEMSKPICWEI